MMQFALQTCMTPAGRRVDVRLLITREVEAPLVSRLWAWLLGRPTLPKLASTVIRGSFVRVPHRYGLLRWSETRTGLSPTDWLAAVSGELQRGVLERHIESVVALAEAGDHRTAAERQAEGEA